MDYIKPLKTISYVYRSLFRNTTTFSDRERCMQMADMFTFGNNTLKGFKTISKYADCEKTGNHTLERKDPLHFGVGEQNKSLQFQT